MQRTCDYLTSTNPLIVVELTMLCSRKTFASRAQGLKQAMPARARQQRLCVQATTAKEFLESCSGLGKVRFIVLGEGAILESVNQFSK